jgi:hypothetical protein
MLGVPVLVWWFIAVQCQVRVVSIVSVSQLLCHLKRLGMWWVIVDSLQRVNIRVLLQTKELSSRNSSRPPCSVWR